jgi:hypothetical protein
MIFKGIMCCALVIGCVGCKSASCVESVTSKVESHDSTALVNMVYSIDTIYQHDSIYIREIQRGDTIYLTRTEWRDRWRTHLVHDTIHNTEYVTNTEYRDRVIEHPPEKYVPGFYKWCTIALWAIGLLAIGYWALRRKLKVEC